MAEIIATENRMSKIFKFSERKIREYFKEARVAPGKYDLLRAMEIFIENSDRKDEANELKKVDKELKEYKLSILKKEHHHEDDVSRIVSDMIYRFKSKINSIPTRLSLELINKSNKLEIEEILKEHLSQALLELSEYKYIEEDYGEEDD